MIMECGSGNKMIIRLNTISYHDFFDDFEQFSIQDTLRNIPIFNVVYIFSHFDVQTFNDSKDHYRMLRYFVDKMECVDLKYKILKWIEKAFQSGEDFVFYDRQTAYSVVEDIMINGVLSDRYLRGKDYLNVFKTYLYYFEIIFNKRFSVEIPSSFEEYLRVILPVKMALQEYECGKKIQVEAKKMQ